MALPHSLWLSRAAFLFAAGSAVLLLGGIAFARAGLLGCGALFGLAWIGASVHALGWHQLYAAGSLDGDGRAIGAVGAGVFAFLAGVVAMAGVSPTTWNFLFLALPYVPFVFGPVVFVHAGLFLSFASALPRREHELVRAGSYVLVAIAALGVGSQVGYLVAGFAGPPLFLGEGWLREVMFWTFFPYPAGLTAMGYSLAWWGWSAVAVHERPPPAHERLQPGAYS